MIQEYQREYWLNQLYDYNDVIDYQYDEEGNVIGQTTRQVRTLHKPIITLAKEASLKTGREWRKYICKHYLANDLLDKLEEFEGVANLMAFVDILTLLSYGMAKTAHDVLSATQVPSELAELKTWLLDALNTIAQD